MKSSTALLAVLFVVVATALFLGVWALLGGDATTTQPPIPKGEGPGTVTTDPQGRPRVDPEKGKSRPPRPRKRLLVAGAVLDADGEGVKDAPVALFHPTEAVPAPETANLGEIKFVNTMFELEPEEWNRPRPLSSIAERPDASSHVPAGAPIATAVSDENGTFTMEVPRHRGLGPFRLTAGNDDLGRGSLLGVRPNSKTPVEVVLGRKGVVTGQVIGGAETHPVPAAVVVFDSDESRSVAITDDDGKFRIEGVNPGHYQVTVGAKGHPPITGRLVAVRRGEPVELRLPRGATLRVRAVTGDAEDIPLADAEIVAMDEDSFAYVMGITDSNGYVDFPGIPEGSWLVNGRAKGQAAFSEEQVLLDGNRMEMEVTVAFEPTVITPLTVVDTTGTPIPGVVFYTGNWDDEYDQVRSARIEGETDAAGRFDFRFEFDGPNAAIFAFKKDYGMTLVIPDDETSGDPMRVVMEKGVRVYGSCKNADGKPVADAVIWFEVYPTSEWAEDDISFQIRTDKNGKFDFPYVPRGEVIVWAETEDDFSDDFEFEPKPGETDFKAELILEGE